MCISLVAALAASLGACRGPKRPPTPNPDRDPLAMLGGPARPAPKLEDLLALHPLGDQSYRADLLAIDADRSIFLVQSRRGIAPHFRRTHRERTCVLAGSGTCWVEHRSYPAVAGSAFKIEPGATHRVTSSDDGSVLVALSVFEPPLAAIDDDRTAVDAR